MKPYQAVERLSSAIQFKTIADPNSTQADISEFLALHRFLKESFPLLHRKLSVEVVARTGLMCHWKGTNPLLNPIGFVAHMDVVPANEEGWQYAPFGGAIAEGYVWGRGTLDMKGHMMALLEAVEELLSKGFRPMRDVYLFLGGNEEIGGAAEMPCCKAMAQILRDRDITLSALIDEGGFVADKALFGVDRNVAVIGIAEKGGANFALKAKGLGGHSSMPPKNSAVGQLAKGIVKLEKNQFPAKISGVAELLFNTLAPHMRGVRRLAMENKETLSPILLKKLLANPATASLLRTTIAVTQAHGSDVANVLPLEASATVNVRIMPGETIESVTKHIKNAVGKSVSVEFLSGSNPTSISSINSMAYTRIVSNIVSSYKGLLIAPYIMMGGTDSKFFLDITKNVYRISPFSSIFTPDNGIHGVGEKIEVGAYLDGIEFFKSLLPALAYRD